MKLSGNVFAFEKIKLAITISIFNLVFSSCSNMMNQAPDQLRQNALSNGSNGSSQSVVNPPGLVDVNAWLASHAKISSKINWIDLGDPGPWSLWNAKQKSDLQQSFSDAYSWYFFNFNGGSDNIPTVPSNLVSPPNDLSLTEHTVIDSDYAWKLYVRWVAHSLLLEVYQLVPWSIITYDDESLSNLLDAWWMMKPSSISSGAFELNDMNASNQSRHGNYGYTVIAPPIYTYKFLKTADIYQAGVSSRKSIENLLQWCNHSNMTHFNAAGYAAPFAFGNMYPSWQYYGGAPFVKVAEGTTSMAANPPTFSHWTAGCYGTSSFMKFALRAINIPAELVYVSGHCVAVFRTEHVFLSHGDDPYTDIGNGNSLAPAGQLVPDTFFQQWFGDSMYSNLNPPWKISPNISIQPRQLSGIVMSNKVIVPFANITLVNNATNTTQNINADSNGSFSLLTMPSNYTVTIKTNCCDQGTSQNILFGNYPSTFNFNVELPQCLVPCGDTF